jgi:hypothetical protein
MLRIPLLYCLIALLVSCGGQPSDQVSSVIDLDQIEEVSQPLTVEKALPLGFTPTLLGSFPEVKIVKDEFWIMDTESRKGIYHFSETGEFLGTVGEVGESPGMVPNLSDFNIYEDSIIVLSSLGDQVKVSRFSANNQLGSVQEIPFNIYSFRIVNDSAIWLYSGYNKVAGKYRLRKVTREGSLKKEFLENLFSETILPIVEPAFFSGDKEVLFRESFKPIIFNLSDSRPIEKYRFDFGSLQVPESFWEMDTFEGFEMINRQGFANINFISETKTHLLVDVLIQSESGVRKEIVILNKVKNEWIKIKVDEENTGYFYTPIGLSGDQIIFISYAPYVVRNLEKLTLSTTAKNSLKFLTEESNPVILYAKIPD